MQGVLLDHFNKLKPSTKYMAQCSSCLSDEIDQDYRTTITHIFTLIQSFFKGFIASLSTTMWDHMYGCEKEVLLCI